MKRANLFEKYKFYLLQIINNLYLKKKEMGGRKQKHSNSYYLDLILRVLFHGNTWESLNCGCDISTVRKVFYKWSNDGIFTTAYNKLLEEYINHKENIIDLFIDATIIQNKNCNETVDYNPKYKGKLSSRITTAVTEDRITVAFNISESRSHDIKFLESTIDKIPSTINPSYHNPLYIITDKGYISESIKKNLKEKNIILVNPNRKNNKNKTNQRYKKKLKGRFVVEASYSHLKNSYKRINLIYDRKISNYTTFFIMAITCEIVRYSVNNRLFSSFLNNVIV